MIVVAVAVGFVVVFVIVVVVVVGVSIAFDMVLVDVVVVVVSLAGAAVAFEVGAVVAAALLEVESFFVAHAVMEQKTSVMRVIFIPRDSTKLARWTHPMQIFKQLRSSPNLWGFALKCLRVNSHAIA